MTPSLASIFTKKFDLTAARSPEELFAVEKSSPRGRAFFLSETPESLTPVTLLADGHFEIEAHAFVYDALLGSFGLVHRLHHADERTSPATIASHQALTETVLRHIDKAIFLRHLLVEAARGRETAEAAVFVEVVFLLPPAGGPSETAAQQAFGDAMRQLVERSTAVNAIGINLWQADQAADLGSDDALRRAFSWLLRDVSAWLHKPPKFLLPPGGAQPRMPAGQWPKEIELENFRVSGRRILPLNPERQIHVVHGYNGSGKTALAEAIEFALTGTVDRIVKAPGGPRTANDSQLLLKALLHQNSRHASVTLRFPDGTEKVVPVGADAEASYRLHHPGAFRLNQTFADQLIGQGPLVAARTILEAFFPDQRAGLDAARESRREASLAVEALPPALRPRFCTSAQKLDPIKVGLELSWLDAAEVSWAQLRAFLPLSLEQVHALAPLLKSDFATAYGNSTGQSLPGLQSHAQALDAEYAALFATAPRLADLSKRTLELLESLRSLSFEDAQEHRPMGELLGDWLERVAHCDIAEREHALLCAIEQAPEPLRSADLPLLADLPPQRLFPDGRRKSLLLLQELRTRALEAWQSRQITTESVPPESPERVRATDHNLTILDEAAQAGLFGAAFLATDWPLSKAVRRAQHGGRVVDVTVNGDSVLRVGGRGWTESLRTTLQPIAQSLASLLPETGGEPARVPSAILAVLKQTHAAGKKLTAASDNLIDEVNNLFADKGQLLRPLNELVALLTPQRWIYRDLAAHGQDDGTEPGFDPQAGDTSARLILNTAEQNACALALFLLCARLQPNPLRLLVLDDPLQNMDEFTVTGVARGLTRLLRLWNQHDPENARWTLLILVHGIENLDRLRTETPCAVIALPWLKPLAGPPDEAPLLLGEPPVGTGDFQPLSSLFEPRSD